MTPDYYAAGVNPSEYVLTGHNFGLLQGVPVKGLYATNNGDPLHYRYYEHLNFQYAVEIISDTKMRLTHQTERVFDVNNYLGGITGVDGDQVYWVNETAPLP